MKVSLWIKDWTGGESPLGESGEWQAEACPVEVKAVRNDEEHVLIQAHYREDAPDDDMVWLELGLSEALALAGQLAGEATREYEPGEGVAFPMWRCECCGKWSHAKRMPKTHRRFIADGSDPAHPEWTAQNIASYLELPTLEEVLSQWNGDPAAEPTPRGVWVACGPFVAFKAVPVLA